MSKRLPLKAAYAFGRAHGLGAEVDRIARMPIRWDECYTSSVRAAYSESRLRWSRDLNRRFENSRNPQDLRPPGTGPQEDADGLSPIADTSGRTQPRSSLRSSLPSPKMPEDNQNAKYSIAMAGEFLVVAELNRRHILGTVTYGTAKSADVWAFAENPSRAVPIEVKTTIEEKSDWVVGEKALEERNPDLLRVLVLLPRPHPRENATDETRGRHSPRFYVLTSGEIRELVSARHERYKAGYRARHERESTRPGVIKLGLDDAARFENDWQKVEQRLK